MKANCLACMVNLVKPKILFSVISEFYWEKIVQGGVGRGGVEEQSNAKKIEVITGYVNTRESNAIFKTH